jgi:hypothetical protein
LRLSREYGKKREERKYGEQGEIREIINSNFSPQ